MADPFLHVERVSKQFQQIAALHEVGFTVTPGEFVCLLGPSGCGKTTLLRIIAGLETPDQGRIVCAGEDITRRPAAERRFAIVFQSYALFPNLTAAENIAFGLRSRRVSRRETEQRVSEVLSLVGLQQMARKYPAQLSGGEQQRVALARAVVLSPRLLLLDEPLSALDAKVRERLRRDIRRLQEQLGLTTVMVTHDQEEALTMADRIIVMDRALIVQSGTPMQVYEQPATPFVADFIGSMNFLSREGAEDAGRRLAIRPEHIHLYDSGADGRLPAVLEHVEFRGSFFRVQLRVEPDSAVFTGSNLLVDVPANQGRSMDLERGRRFHVEFPDHRLLSYGTTRIGTGQEQAG